MTSLIIGGTSGLGLELAKLLAPEGRVIVTGRHNPRVSRIEYRKFNLATKTSLSEAVHEFAKDLPEIHNFVYAAGYFQDGTITDLSDKDIKDMLNVGIHAPIWFIKDLLEKQGELDEFIAITSTSQWIPRLKEPIFTAIKAGFGHFAHSISLDERVGKTLVVGPAGMRTDFWEGVEREDFDEMLEPEWVAAEIMKLRHDDYGYRFAKLLRQPARVELIETI